MPPRRRLALVLSATLGLGLAIGAAATGQVPPAEAEAPAPAPPAAEPVAAASPASPAPPALAEPTMPAAEPAAPIQPPPGAATTSTPTPAPAEPDLGDQVRRLFETRCTKCHGPDVARPKGKFGHVTDLGRIAAEPRLVVRMQPDQSELYRLVHDGEMPPEDSGVAALSEAEAELVRRWIEAGAPPDRSALPGSPAEAPAGSVAGPPLPWRLRLGRMHPATVHLAIGLIPAAALAELLAMLTGRAALRTTARYCLILGSLGAVVSAVLGWWNAEAPAYAVRTSRELFLHRWVGVFTATWCVLATAWSEWQALRNGSRIRYRVAIFAAALLVLLAGLLGGVNVYGLDHYLR